MAILNNVFILGAGTDGTVQAMNVGFNDDGNPINYEVETQEIEFGNRAHLKKLSGELATLTKFAGDSQMEVTADDGNPLPIPMSMVQDGVNLTHNMQAAGRFFSFKWYGVTVDSSPVLEGLYIEQVQDLGITPV